ncbi:MAG: hypothetical protein PHF25_01270, partial [Candidatus Margulisbacteria bacterium]|nr:hypothetical protein [Candidatus Margulisiibacteriota bacterium]
MRWNTKLLVSLLFFTVSISFTAPLELIVKYKETTGKQVKSSNAQIKSSRLVARVEGFVEKYKNTKLFKDNYIVRASSSENYLELLEQLQNDPNVEYVHPNYVYHK